MIREHVIDADKKQQFAGIVTLNYLMEEGGSLSLPLAGDDAALEPTLSWLVERGHVTVRGEQYAMCPSGLDAVRIFQARFREFVRIFDIYAFVDLVEAEFAYEKFFEFKAEHEWDDYIEQENWADLRIAVAEFKGLDPLEIVFLSFVNEGLFDEAANWQRDIHDDELWHEVQELCNCSVAIEDLSFEDEDEGAVDGREVLQEIVIEGAEMNLELKALEEELSENDPDYEADRDENDVAIDVEAYYTPYIQPDYLGAVWANNWKL